MWLALIHGFLLAIRYMCGMVEHIVDKNCCLLEEYRTTDHQTRVARVLDEIGQIYLDIGDLLQQGTYFLELPVTFLLFFCFTSLVSMSFDTFTMVMETCGGNIIQVAHEILSKCSWALMLGIYVAVILKNLDHLTEQVSDMFNTEKRCSSIFLRRLLINHPFLSCIINHS
jgi:hypothetical protein